MMSLARDFEKLTSANYHNWKFDMRMVLIGKDLWDIVSGDDVLDENASEADRTHYRRRDQKAMSNICLAISSELKIYVRNAKTSKEAWDELANHFEEKTLSRKINFRRQLYNCKLTGEMTMVQHINNIKTISEHLEALDNPVSEEDLVMILFTSVPEDYNNLVTTLETLKEEKLTWVYVRDRLITEYERKRVVKDEHEETQKHGEVHGALFAGAKSNKPEFRCHYCNKQGHFIKNCYERKRDEAEQRRRDVEDEKDDEKEAATFCRAETESQENDDFTPEFALHVGVEKKKEDWLLDSACSRHITGCKEDLANYKKFTSKEESQYVVLADKSMVKAEGQGNLNLYLRDTQGRRVPVTFRNVLYAPNIKRLISISDLTERGAEVTFKRRTAVLTISGRRFVFGTKEGKMFKMNECNYANVMSASEVISEKKRREVKYEARETIENETDPSDGVGDVHAPSEDRSQRSCKKVGVASTTKPSVALRTTSTTKRSAAVGELTSTAKLSEAVGEYRSRKSISMPRVVNDWKRVGVLESAFPTFMRKSRNCNQTQ